MSELLEKDQILSLVPQNFRNSNKGKITNVGENNFSLELSHAPEGISVNNFVEIYSPTKNGMLYFSSNIENIDGSSVTIRNPLRHRFLQRRAFTRVKFSEDMFLSLSGKTYKIKPIDVSAGGIKLRTEDYLDLNSEYDLNITLPSTQKIPCKFQPIRIEKNDDGSYTLSGRFQISSNADKMTLIQFCIKKNIENANR